MKMELVTTLKRRAKDINAAAVKDRDPILILEKIDRAEQAIEEGRVVSHKNARKHMSRWLK